MITITVAIARAAAQDAGNKHMKDAGRTTWNEEDWNAAAEELGKLWPEEESINT